MSSALRFVCRIASSKFKVSAALLNNVSVTSEVFLATHAFLDVLVELTRAPPTINEIRNENKGEYYNGPKSNYNSNDVYVTCIIISNLTDIYLWSGMFNDRLSFKIKRKS